MVTGIDSVEAAATFARRQLEAVLNQDRWMVAAWLITPDGRVTVQRVRGQYPLEHFQAAVDVLVNDLNKETQIAKRTVDQLEPLPPAKLFRHDPPETDPEMCVALGHEE